jgi:hypothetical protein
LRFLAIIEIAEILQLQHNSQVVLVSYPEVVIQGVILGFAEDNKIVGQQPARNCVFVRY